MLGAVSATGQFPIEATKTVASILADAESPQNYYALHSFIRDFSAKPFACVDAAASCLARTSMDSDIALVVTFTLSGAAARVACKFRPACVHVVVSLHAAVAASCSLSFGALGVAWPELRTASLAAGVAAAVDAAKLRGVYQGGAVAVMHGTAGNLSADEGAAITVMRDGSG